MWLGMSRPPRVVAVGTKSWYKIGLTRLWAGAYARPMTNNNTAATAAATKESAMSDYSYPSVAALVADQANLVLEMFGPEFDIRPEAAVDQVARALVTRATDARTRNGSWASETTTEEIDAALFYGVVAQDILDGKVARPSTGNVRAYTLALVAA